MTHNKIVSYSNVVAFLDGEISAELRDIREMQIFSNCKHKK